jgi:hypothetical protein
MELIDVTAHFDKEGQSHPLHFTWNGRSYTVESTGRRWQDENGQHILVMIPGDHTFELIFQPQEGRWYLRQVGVGPASLA